MAKRISYNSLSNSAIMDFSDYHVAFKKVQALNAAFRKAKKSLDEQIAANISSRETAIKRGEMTEEEAVKKYDIAALYREINALREQLRVDCKPHKDRMSAIQDKLPEGLFSGYKSAMDKGEMSHLTKACETYLQHINATNPGGKAVSKFAQTMAIWVAGKRKASGKALEDGKYVTNKNERTFKELFMLCMLEILINEKGVLVVADDNTLSMKKFD